MLREPGRRLNQSASLMAQALLRTVSVDRRLYWQKILMPDETILSTLRSADTWRGNPGAIWAVRPSHPAPSLTRRTRRASPLPSARIVPQPECPVSLRLRSSLHSLQVSLSGDLWGLTPTLDSWQQILHPRCACALAPPGPQALRRWRCARCARAIR